MGYQFRMITLLDDFPFLQHNDRVCIFYRTLTMGDDDDGSVFKKELHIIHNRFLIIGIQRVGRFIEKYICGVFINCASYQDTLLLACT